MGRYGAMNIFRIPRESDRRAVFHALERVDLLDLRNRPIGSLSGGQRKRAFLARAIAEGHTILISTHDLNHVRDFCDFVVLINKTVLAYGETSEVFTSENLNKTFGGIPPNPLSGPESSKDFVNE